MSEGYSRVARSVRGSWTENVHFGLAAVSTPDGRLIARLGDPSRSVFLRSAAKPVQILPLLEAGGREAFDLSPAEIALMCSSHAGSDDHVTVVRELLNRTALSEQALACGVHPPLGRAAADALRDRREEPGTPHNNCSANHVGQLLACRALDWPLDGYQDLEHPLQQRVLRQIAEFAGLDVSDIQIGIDGCGLPSFRVPLAAASRLYALLADPSGTSAAGSNGDIGIALDAMAAHPEMVAGPGRFTTELIRATGGRIIGKEGAEGFYGAVVRGPVALGVAVKISDGADSCRDAVVVEVLRQAGCLSQLEFEVLAPFQRVELRNHSGTRIGELTADLELIEVGSG
ncbi:MAG: asparaginase [Thermoanaerobaculia bacterium]